LLLIGFGVGARLLLPIRTHADAPPDRTHLTERAHRLEEKLIAPCCFMQTLANHSSPKADEMKREIRERLQQGWSEDQVLQSFLDRYGERILAEPLAKGFNIFAYVVPPMALVCAAVACVLWLRRRVVTRSEPSDAGPPVWDESIAEQMRSELRAFD